MYDDVIDKHEQYEDYEDSDDEPVNPFDEAEEEPVKKPQNANKSMNAEDAGEEKPKRKNVVRKPRVMLNDDKLKSTEGVIKLPELFKDIKLKGKYHEKDDLNQIMGVYQNWAHRLMPSLQFDDFIEKAEALCKKAKMKTYLTKIRLGMPLDIRGEVEQNEEVMNQYDSEDENYDPVSKLAPKTTMDDEFMDDDFMMGDEDDQMLDKQFLGMNDCNLNEPNTAKVMNANQLIDQHDESVNLDQTTNHQEDMNVDQPVNEQEKNTNIDQLMTGEPLIPQNKLAETEVNDENQKIKLDPIHAIEEQVVNDDRINNSENSIDENDDRLEIDENKVDEESINKISSQPAHTDHIVESISEQKENSSDVAQQDSNNLMENDNSLNN